MTTDALQERLESVREAYAWTVRDPNDEWAWDAYDGAGRAFAEACRGHWLRVTRPGRIWECRIGTYAEGALWASRSREGRDYPWPLALEQIETVEVLEAPEPQPVWWSLPRTLSWRPVFSAWRAGR